MEKIRNVLKNINDYIYPAICIVSILISIVLICIVIFSQGPTAPVHNPFSPASDKKETPAAQEKKETAAGPIVITNEQAGALIEAALPEDFPLTGINITFTNDHLRLDASADRDKLIAFFGEEINNMPSVFKGALALVPENTELGFDFGLTSASDNPLILLPESASMGKLTFRASSLPEDIYTEIINAVNSSLKKYASVFSKAEAGEGILTLYS